MTIPLDLMTTDTKTMRASAELDELVGVWAGLRIKIVDGVCRRLDVQGKIGNRWAPSTNPAHAGEARRKTHDWRLIVRSSDDCLKMGIQCTVWLNMKTIGIGFCSFAETDANEGRTEALATCRAIVEALQAKAKTNRRRTTEETK